MGAEFPEGLLLLPRLRVVDVCPGEIDHGEMKLLRLNTAEPPQESIRLFQQPALCRLLFQIGLDARTVIEGEIGKDIFIISHFAPSSLKQRR